MKTLNALKHMFIPHEHNDYKPHLFRELSVIIILTGSIFLLGVSFGSSYVIHKTVLGASVTANVLVDLTNESRLAYNEAPLVRNPTLDQAATLKAEDMATEGYFAHDSPKGITPWHWFKEAGYTFLYAGENLAINFTDAAEVRDAWLKSPTHRANLLNVKFKEIGMATVSGVYRDGPTIYVVQMFGTPAMAKEVAPEIKTETIPAPTETTPTPSVEEPEPTVAEGELAVKTENQPAIKGETITEAPQYEAILTTEELAVVKNNEATEIPTMTAPVEYSTWYEKALFGGSYYVDLAYRALFAFIVLALFAMIFIEVRRQHWKHITYGLALLLGLAMCIIINQAFW